MSFNYVEQTMERVLVIDDDVGLCELVGEYLQPEGYTVEAIHNGERGIDRALAGEHEVDCQRFSSQVYCLRAAFTGVDFK